MAKADESDQEKTFRILLINTRREQAESKICHFTENLGQGIKKEIIEIDNKQKVIDYKSFDFIIANPGHNNSSEAELLENILNNRKKGAWVLIYTHDVSRTSEAICKIAR